MIRLTVVTATTVEQFLRVKLCYSLGGDLVVMYFDQRHCLRERRIARPYTLEKETYDESVSVCG